MDGKKIFSKRVILILLVVSIAILVLVIAPSIVIESSDTTVELTPNTPPVHDQPSIVIESPNTTEEPTQEIKELQQSIKDQGYNYTVADNWITRLSPEEQEALCGYKPIEAPREPPSENISFVLDVP